jgi:hypothetical protein
MTIRELQRQAYVVELAYKRARVTVRVEDHGTLTGILGGLCDQDGRGVTSADDLDNVRVLLNEDIGNLFWRPVRIKLARITEIAEVA